MGWLKIHSSIQVPKDILSQKHNVKHCEHSTSTVCKSREWRARMDVISACESKTILMWGVLTAEQTKCSSFLRYLTTLSLLSFSVSNRPLWSLICLISYHLRRDEWPHLCHHYIKSLWILSVGISHVGTYGLLERLTGAPYRTKQMESAKPKTTGLL